MKMKKYKVRGAVVVTIEEIYSNMHGGRKVTEQPEGLPQ